MCERCGNRRGCAVHQVAVGERLLWLCDECLVAFAEKQLSLLSDEQREAWLANVDIAAEWAKVPA